MNTLVMRAPWAAVGDYFERDGDSRGLMYFVLTMMALTALLAIVHNTLGGRSERAPANNPEKLFRDVLAKRGLGVKERDLLRRLARDRRVEHPITLLLSPIVFRQHAAEWLVDREGARAPTNLTENIDSLYHALFDEPLRNQAGD